jgi:predicted Rdx family selenoprotein
MKAISTAAKTMTVFGCGQLFQKKVTGQSDWNRMENSGFPKTGTHHRIQYCTYIPIG